MLFLDKGSKTVIYYLPQQCFAHPSLAPLPHTYEWMTELSPGSQFLCSCPRTVGTSILPSLELLCLFSSHSPSGSFAPYVAFCATPFMFYSFFIINNNVTQLFIFKIILFPFFFCVWLLNLKLVTLFILTLTLLHHSRWYSLAFLLIEWGFLGVPFLDYHIQNSASTEGLTRCDTTFEEIIKSFSREKKSFISKGKCV